MCFTFAVAMDVERRAVAFMFAYSLNHGGSEWLVLPLRQESCSICASQLFCVSVCAMEQALVDLVHADCVANQRTEPFEQRVIKLLE